MTYNKPTLFQGSRKDEKTGEKRKQEVDSIIISVSLGEGQATSKPAIVLDLGKKNMTAKNVACSYWKGQYSHDMFSGQVS